MKKILFIIDKIELKYFEFNKLVTNFWIIKEFLERQHDVYIATIPMLSLNNQTAYTQCYKTYTKDQNIFYEETKLNLEINSFDLVMFRPDPPVDIDYINATYIFDFVNTSLLLWLLALVLLIHQLISQELNKWYRRLVERASNLADKLHKSVEWSTDKCEAVLPQA